MSSVSIHRPLSYRRQNNHFHTSAGHLLSHFGDFIADVGVIDSNKDISRRIFETVIVMIENEFYSSIAIEISSEIKFNELEDDPTYEPITKKGERSSWRFL